MPTAEIDVFASKPVAATQLERTPGLLLGPYYPVNPAATSGAQLWQGGHTLQAPMRRMVFSGRVLNIYNDRIAGATIEIWHADPNGVYAHPSDQNHRHVLPGFVGYGITHSDRQGNFVFHSIAPGPYAMGLMTRAPHIHLQVTAQVDRLVTQLFFPNHPLNATDRWYGAAVHPDRLMLNATRDDMTVIEVSADLVLNRG